MVIIRECKHKDELESRPAKRRLMAKTYSSLTGEERIARASRLIQDSWKYMSEEGRRVFMARNFKKRRMRKTGNEWKPLQNF